MKPDSTKRSRTGWLVPTGLILVALIPIVAGASRVTQLSTGVAITADNARFFTSPIPVVAHIVGATVFCVVGAFQFVPSLRRFRWHRHAGRVVAPAGIIAGLSGMWMAAFYPLPAGDGPLLLAFRLIFGAGMVTSLALGLIAVRRRAFSRHGDWMTRGYALGLAAGTQAIFLAIYELTIGPQDVTSRALVMGFAWVFNLAFAEVVIRRRALKMQQRRSRARLAA